MEKMINLTEIITRIEKMDADIYFLPFKIDKKIRVEINDIKTHKSIGELFIKTEKGDMDLQLMYLSSIHKYILENKYKYVWVCIVDYSIRDEDTLHDLLSRHKKI